MAIFMKGISRYILTMLVPFLCLSCTDEIPMPAGCGAAGGVDRGKTVRVSLPFSVSGGIRSDIVTRAAGTEDSRLGRIMLFMYENKGKDQSQNKLLGYRIFLNSNEGTVNNEEDGFWTGEGNEGRLNFYAYPGDVYIYLLGNVTGSFLKYFPGMQSEEELKGLTDQEKFFQAVRPTWTGNFNMTDGYLPLAGSVNNSTAACRIGEDGTVTYMDDATGTETRIDSINNPFLLKRLMAKISFTFKSKEGVTFTPRSYQFRHVAEWVSPKFSQDRTDKIGVTDGEQTPFNPQTPNSFLVYVPENMARTQATGITSFHDREKIKKGSSGINLKETQEGHESHYQFENAPENTTYVEVTGHFKGKDNKGMEVEADVKYTIHLGDFSDGNFNNFDVERDHYYKYTVTVNGVDEIIAEVETNRENQPGAEGVVFRKGSKVRVDAHYEAVEMNIRRSVLEQGIYIYCKTPFGTVGEMYYPQKGADDANLRAKEILMPYLGWVKFQKQDTKGELAIYDPKETQNVFEVLQEVWNENGEGAYYTCFVDEYYYEENPVNKGNVRLNEFVNADDRVFTLATSLQYSKDQQSILADAVYSVSQRSIACFYDLDNFEGNVYGVESVDETGGLYCSERFDQDLSLSENPDKDGRGNTLAQCGANGYGYVNWKKNGYLLQNDGSYKKEGGYTTLSYDGQYSYKAWAGRNRDLDGSGTLEENEIRWYVCARDQIIGMWIAEPALPTEAVLCPEDIETLLAGKTSENPVARIHTNSGRSSRLVWSEQGCSFGGEHKRERGNIRCARNLGITQAAKRNASHTIFPDRYYEYDNTTKTITMNLSSIALRGFTSRELAPHNERSVINRVPKVLQVSSDFLYGKVRQDYCGGHGLWRESFSKEYYPFITSTAKDAKDAWITEAASYVEQDSKVSSVQTSASWRLPNQRELALIVVAAPELLRKTGAQVDGNTYDYNDTFIYKKECEGNPITGHNWKNRYRASIHCRTRFSINSGLDGNGSYTVYGYCCYYNKNGSGQVTDTGFLGLMSIGYNNEWLGYGDAGYAGYRCVRDIE